MSQGPALVIKASALQFGLLRLGQKATDSIQIQNISQLPATWCMKESLMCLQERQESVSQAPLAKWTPPRHTHTSLLTRGAGTVKPVLVHLEC